MVQAENPQNCFSVTGQKKTDLLCLKTAQFPSQLQPGHPDDCRDFLGAPASVAEMGSGLSVPSMSKMIPEARELFAHLSALIPRGRI